MTDIIEIFVDVPLSSEAFKIARKAVCTENTKVFERNVWAQLLDATEFSEGIYRWRLADVGWQLP